MHGVVVVRFLRGFCDRWWSSRGVERTRAESVRRWGVSSPHFLQASDDSAWSRRARSRRGVDDVVGLRTESSCTESSVYRVLRGFCDRRWSARGVERTRAESVRRWGVSSPHFLQASEDFAWSRRVRSRRGVDDVVAAKTGTATVSSCRGVHLVVGMAGTTEHSFGAWLHPGPKLFALVLCVHSYSQDRCDKTFVLLMRAPRCNHGRCD